MSINFDELTAIFSALHTANSMQSLRVSTIVEQWRIEAPLFCQRRCASDSAVFSTSSQHKRMLLGSFCSLPGILRSRLEVLHRYHSQGHDVIELLDAYLGIPW